MKRRNKDKAARRLGWKAGWNAAVIYGYAIVFTHTGPYRTYGRITDPRRRAIYERHLHRAIAARRQQRRHA